MVLPHFLNTLIVLIALFPFLDNTVTSQNNFDAYRQDIPGSNLSFRLVPIPKGEFVMGSSPKDMHAEPDEFPAHRVALDAFWMGTHEITWDIFELYLDKNLEASLSGAALPDEVDGISRPSTPYLDMTFGMGKGKKPALAMTQYNAIQFCKWLYLKTGVFYRLPTEAEWEYAARAGSKTAYFFGEDPGALEAYAWYGQNSGDMTHETGSKKPNAWGLYDILGNVMEWTYDKYLPKYQVEDPNKAVTNPVVVADELYPHSLRGGHYKSGAADLRSANRFSSTPVWKQLDPQIPKSKWWFPEAPFVGIRIVRPLDTPSRDEIMAYYDKAPIDDY